MSTRILPVTLCCLLAFAATAAEAGGCYFMFPPKGEPDAPLSQWKGSTAFDTIRECENYKRNITSYNSANVPGQPSY